VNITTPQNTQDYSSSKQEFLGWITEPIWGHRLQRQPKSALLLEFLGMAEAMHRQHKLFSKTEPGENVVYEANLSLHLRSILFNNPRMQEIREQYQGGDEEAWQAWLREMKDTAAVRDKFSADFSFLRQRFSRFHDLAARVNLLRRIAVDPGAARSWTEQFLFPIGPAALFESVYTDLTRNRVLFTRTGEIAYLMLSRASDQLRASLGEKLGCLLAPLSPRNKLLMSLIPTQEPEKASPKGGAYLPYKEHPAFDRIAADIDALLSLELPDQDAFEHLEPILALNLYIYGIETANHWIGKEEIPPVACEILAPSMDIVRKASVATFTDNEGLGVLAVRRFAENAIQSDPEASSKLCCLDLDEEAKAELLTDHISKACSVERDKIKAPDHQSVRRNFLALAEKGYREGTAGALQGLASVAGLASRVGTNRVRYAPSDKLLQALVLVNVKHQVEESEFLRTLHFRYHIIIGPDEAQKDMPSGLCEEIDFKNNKERLARRLIGLGLAQRMSDACTYIRNPFYRTKA
jgi:hypothetical protein